MTNAILTFCKLLREEYAINAGHDRAYEALRAIEVAGIAERERVRHAMRLALCASPEERVRFDRAFDAFFTGRQLRRIRRQREVPGDTAVSTPAAIEKLELHHEDDASPSPTVLAARYSRTAMPHSRAPEIPKANLERALRDASAFIAAVHIGPSRRWKAGASGERFDLRGTLRSSLRTAGDPVRIRMLRHPLRNPRIVMLLDGSRSMADYALLLLQFAYALCRRSNRVRVFTFSTALREITRQLRTVSPRAVEALGEAWGGGTRIGAAFSEFRHKYGSNLTADTVVLVASDGLDSEAGAALQQAMRDMHRRSAGILWLNPHVREAGFEPSAHAMKTALPYISALIDARDLHALAGAARLLRR